MRILHLTTSFPRSEDESTAPYLLRLARGLADAGHEVTVVAPHDAAAAATESIGAVAVTRFRYAPASAERLAYRGGLLERVRTPIGLVLVGPFLVAFAIAAARAALRSRPEVIHAHWWFPAGVIAIAVGRALRVPVVVTVHGSDAELVRKPAFAWLWKRVIRDAAVTAAVSHDLARRCETLGRPGVGVLRMPIGPVRRSPLPAATPVRVLAVGRLSREKGFDVLVEAAAVLAFSGEKVAVEIVGAGPLERPLREAAHAAGGAVTFSAPVAPAELLARIAKAHALVVPSRREGLGLVAVEALAAGRPVIASRVGGLPEAVSDGEDGLLVPSDDPAAVADALRRLPLRAPRGSAVARHSLGAVVDAHLHAYAEAVERGAPRRGTARWLGVLLAVAIGLALTRLVARDWAAVREAWSDVRLLPVLLAIGAAAMAELAFALASSFTLRRVIGPVASMRSGAAAFLVGQNAKHVPGAIWVGVARVALARRWGLPARRVLLWIATESLASVAAGLVVGAIAMALSREQTPLVWGPLAVTGALVPLTLHARSPLRSLAARALGEVPTPNALMSPSAGYVVPWTATGATTVALAAALDIPLLGALALGGAACVASVAGFLAVPVPAGLGVREATFAALVAPVAPASVAVSIALAARVLSTSIQLVLGAVAIPLIRAGVVADREKIAEGAGGSAEGPR